MGIAVALVHSICVLCLWVQLSIFSKVTQESVNGSLLISICSHFPFGSAISQSDERIIGMSFFLTSVPLVMAALADRSVYLFSSRGLMMGLQSSGIFLSSIGLRFSRRRLQFFFSSCWYSFWSDVIKCLFFSTASPHLWYRGQTIAFFWPEI